MAHEATPNPGRSRGYRPRHVWLAASLSFIVGLPAGYFLRPPPGPAVPSHVASSPAAAPDSPAPGAASLEEVQQEADQQLVPLLQQLTRDPNNVSLLSRIAAIYHVSHQFTQAADYYGRALAIDPRNSSIRGKRATSLYRAGDVETAIAELKRVLHDNPRDADALFNLGVMKSQGKGDIRGAIAAWQKLLQSNPQLPADRKATVLTLIAQAATAMGDQQGGGRSHAGQQANP